MYCKSLAKAMDAVDNTLQAPSVSKKRNFQDLMFPAMDKPLMQRHAVVSLSKQCNSVASWCNAT